MKRENERERKGKEIKRLRIITAGGGRGRDDERKGEKEEKKAEEA